MFQLFVFWTAVDASLVGVLLPSSGTFWESVRLLPLYLLIKLWNIFMSPNINYSFTQVVLLFLSGYSKGYSFILFELCLIVIMQLCIHLLKT